eukprot:675_1
MAYQPVEDQQKINLNNGLSKFYADINHRNALIVSIGMLWIFCPFQAIQNFATSVSETVGSISLGIYYGTLAIFCIVTPNIISIKCCNNINRLIFIASFSISIYIASYIKLYTPVLYFASFILGIGGALLWSLSSLILTKSSNYYEIENGLPLNSKLGYFNSIYWSFFMST